MQLDHVQIRVRERGHLEILDLSLAVIRRHWMGLGMATMLGVGPFFILNQSMMDAFEGSEVFAILLLIVIEIPWATALITLYLGQVTFSERVSVRMMIRFFAGSLVQMFVLQGCLRSFLTMLSGLVFPLLFLLWGMKYLNEIILLERGSIRQTMRRQSSFHRSVGSRLIGESCINAALGVFLTFLLCHGLLSLTHLLFRSQPLGWDWQEWSDTSIMLELFPVDRWEAQIAIWIVLSFFAVTRYLSYLDHRIRSEGWEVELKLRAQGARIVTEEWI